MTKIQFTFRYECALQLDQIIIYPDFTIKHPRTSELFYWEHFGLMDNPSYAQNVPNKLRTYISNGIIPGINLITTYETQANPLSVEAIQKLVEYYFSNDVHRCSRGSAGGSTVHLPQTAAGKPPREHDRLPHPGYWHQG